MLTLEDSRVARSLRLTLKSAYETLAISAPTVVDTALGRVTKEACDQRLVRWSENIVHATNMRLEVVGRDRLSHGTYVVMSNHQSHYDVPLLFHVIGGNLRMIAKQELFRIPVFGAAMRGAGFIAIDRGDRARAIQSLEEAKPLLRAGTHIWIAPEGTRSVDGKLGPFKKGGFLLAEGLGIPILPVTISGTRNVLPSRGLLTSPGERVCVTFHAPIDPPAEGQAGGREARDATMAAVRQAIASGLP